MIASYLEMNHDSLAVHCIYTCLNWSFSLFPPTTHMFVAYWSNFYLYYETCFAGITGIRIYMASFNPISHCCFPSNPKNVLVILQFWSNNCFISSMVLLLAVLLIHMHDNLSLNNLEADARWTIEAIQNLTCVCRREN